MRKLRHPVAAFVLFSLLASLFVGVYDGLVIGYGISREDTVGGEDVMQRLSNLNLVEGINQVSLAIKNLQSPANPFDQAGALASAAIGVLQTAGGIVVFPLEILGIITDFYYVPPAVTVGVGVILVVYVGFLILSAYQRWEL